MLRIIYGSVVIVALITSSALAEHHTNCSNAAGSLTRKETPVWGSNLIEWTLDGKKVDRAVETWDEESKVVLVNEGDGWDNSHRVYAIKISLYQRSKNSTNATFDDILVAQDWIICDAHSNGMRD